MQTKKILFIGNFSGASYTTENDRKWSLEKLGHIVIPIQENNTNSITLLRYISDVDLVLYSHTHDPSYIISGLINVFGEFKKKGIPTASVHLDLWRNLERWSDVGKEATWFVEHIFTPDNTGEWPIKINHHYMRPGIKESSCYIAPPDFIRFPHEIVFIGSGGYHKEWAWRPQLINWLRNTYGNRFGHYGGGGYPTIREHDLNVLCSTAKIVVGDSCFAGQIKGYYSDRVPELTGRGAFLLHPKNFYIENNGVVQFDLNFSDLQNKIEYYLAHNDLRESKRLEAFNYTKEHDNYTKISEEILNIIF